MVGYVERVLQPGEDIKHVSRLHWIVYVRGLVLLIIGLIGLILLAPGQSPHASWGNPPEN
jgi:hypothetical protein